jgi:hypothetical protein
MRTRVFKPEAILYPARSRYRHSLSNRARVGRGIAHRVLNVPVAEIILNKTGSFGEFACERNSTGEEAHMISENGPARGHPFVRPHGGASSTGKELKMELRMISLAKLVPSTSNVRKTGATVGLEEMTASILAVGLLQNLQVRACDGDKYEVVADLDGDKVGAGRASMHVDAEAMFSFGWNRAQRQPWPVVNPRDAPASLLRKNVLELSSAHSSSDAQRTRA